MLIPIRGEELHITKRGQYDQGDLGLNKALEIEPRNALVYYNRGIVYYDKGQYDQAISDYNKALEINPRECLGLR